MMEREYHYLISGLPNISPDDTKGWISMADFRSYLKEHLHPDDFLEVELIFLKLDHRNIIKYFETGKIDSKSAGNFKVEEFNDYDKLVSETSSTAGSVPPYMAEVLLRFGNEKGELNISKISRMLENGFYTYIMDNACSFLKGFYEFDYNLNNLLSFDKAVKHNIDPQKFISGDSPHAQHLKNHTGKTMVKDPDFEYFDEIISFTRNPSFAEEERKVDLLRWRVIDDMIIFKNFTIDQVLAYLLKMMIIDRWSMLKKQAGEKKLRKIMTEFKLEETKIPEFSYSQ
jgi:hypothetical protein